MFSPPATELPSIVTVQKSGAKCRLACFRGLTQVSPRTKAMLKLKHPYVDAIAFVDPEIRRVTWWYERRDNDTPNSSFDFTLIHAEHTGDLPQPLCRHNILFVEYSSPLEKTLNILNCKREDPPRFARYSEGSYGCIPNLPAPWDFAPYAETARGVDPLGQNRAIIQDSLKNAIEKAKELVGLANSVDAYPFRSTISAPGELGPLDELTSDIAKSTASGSSRSRLLSLLLRLCRSVLELDRVFGNNENDVDIRSIRIVKEILENIGYVCTSAYTNIYFLPDQFLIHYRIGQHLSRLHSGNVIFGDAHRANFAMDRISREAALLDFTLGAVLQRELSANERAMDACIARAECSFYEWQCFLRGYRSPEEDATCEVIEILNDAEAL